MEVKNDLLQVFFWTNEFVLKAAFLSQQTSVINTG